MLDPILFSLFGERDLHERDCHRPILFERDFH